MSRSHIIPHRFFIFYFFTHRNFEFFQFLQFFSSFSLRLSNRHFFSFFSFHSRKMHTENNKKEFTHCGAVSVGLSGPTIEFPWIRRDVSRLFALLPQNSTEKSKKKIFFFFLLSHRAKEFFSDFSFFCVFFCFFAFAHSNRLVKLGV